ncbi:netrin-1-like, partial [Paramacrobiotus metropolitanus]|uniref:netrin-1-like n=1 Tax=Paramacrobiotus metropolitanus TaxID=2943436 RepID=UPI0024457798
ISSSPTKPTDPCYDALGKPRRCITDFVNAAFGKEVRASSTCGTPATRYCQASYNADGEKVRNCQICDDANPKRQHPATYLTDLNNPNNLTCWQSEPFTEEEEGKNVTLTLSLGKKYELTYISLQFCTQRPDSLAIYKSVDYGRTWVPFQFYSSDCKAVFGKPNRVTITKTNEQEALCTDAHLTSNALEPGAALRGGAIANGINGGRVAFSTLEGRPSAFDVDNSPILQDWVTATDIRVVFKRFKAPDTDSATVDDSDDDDNSVDTDPTDDALTTGMTIPSLIITSNETDTSVTSSQSEALTSYASALVRAKRNKLKESYYYALSDFAVGGRAKCNGHAARTVYDRQGRLVCDCKHNTAGADCEKCKPFHYDHPWGRATTRDAHECVACNCHGHSRRCQFSMELFKLSGKKSGGVCMNCRHNTAGRYCHQCKEGFYRDPTKPLTHRKVCIECECHPVGASGRSCNQTTGQCTCKEGVIGLTCNRCAKGYQQSRSPVAPCVKIPKTAQELNGIPSTDAQDDKCGTCEVMSRKVNQRKYCKRDYVIHAQLLSRDTEGQWIRFTMNVLGIYKRGMGKISKGDQYIYLHQSDFLCKCPKLRLGQQYLIMGRYPQIPGQLPTVRGVQQTNMVIDAHSTVIDWKDEWARRLRKFHKRERKGRCKKVMAEGAASGGAGDEEDEE